MFEKPWFQKLNKIADWIIRIVILNIVLVVFSIGIVTLYIGFKVAYELFKDYTEGKETPLFKGIWELTKKDFLKNLGLGALLAFLIAFGILNMYYYNNNIKADASWFYYMGFFVTFMFTVGVYLIAIYSVSVFHLFAEISIKNGFKLSFYLAGKYLFRTLLLLMINVIPFLLLFNPYTAPFFVLCGLSVPAVLNVLLTRKPLNFLKGEERNV